MSKKDSEGNGSEKRIETITGVRVDQLKFDFGNPRKITKRKREELLRSMQTYGDFGIILIDENYNVIGGNQRASVLKEADPDATVDCKMLIGYSEAELRSINIRDNTHSGEWDLELLADWTADLNLDLGLDMNNEKAGERKIDEMELIHYEKYDYVLIVCRDELSYNSLTRSLGIDDKKVLIGPKKRPARARAIWFDQMNVDFVPRQNVGQGQNDQGQGNEQEPATEVGEAAEGSDPE